jgi:hypothetical protein
MLISVRDAEIRFLEALHVATERNLISWKKTLDDDRDVFEAEVDGEVIAVELVYFRVASGETCERVLARVAGMKTHFHVALGTKAYDLISGMLSMQVEGWDKGRADGLSRLEKATARVESLVGKH